MGEYYVGQIILWAGKSLPNGWLPCDGRTLMRHHYMALYEVIGDTYGGDTQSKFNIPNLSGRTVKQAQTLSNIGIQSGTNVVTLSINNMPAHSHTVYACRNIGNTNTPVNNWLANTNNESGTEDKDYASTGQLVKMGGRAISIEGQREPFSIVQPYLGLSYIICVQGLMPGE